MRSDDLDPNDDNQINDGEAPKRKPRTLHKFDHQHTRQFILEESSPNPARGHRYVGQPASVQSKYFLLNLVPKSVDLGNNNSNNNNNNNNNNSNFVIEMTPIVGWHNFRVDLRNSETSSSIREAERRQADILKR